MQSFAEFLAAHQHDYLHRDVTWRAYAIEDHWRELHVRHALKHLGYNYAGEHALGELMAHFSLIDRPGAKALLGSWWLWSQLDKGRRMGVPKRVRMGRPTGRIETPALSDPGQPQTPSS